MSSANVHLRLPSLVLSLPVWQEGMDVVLVQEYAEGGDLYRLLHRNGGRLSERQAVEMVLHPFLLALHYLHTRGIMHRDVKVCQEGCVDRLGVEAGSEGRGGECCTSFRKGTGVGLRGPGMEQGGGTSTQQWWCGQLVLPQLLTPFAASPCPLPTAA